MKKLEELLNLPDSKELIKKEEQKQRREKRMDEKKQNKIKDEISEIDKISSSIPSSRDIGKLADYELTDVADKAMEAYETLMDLGMNVEVRYSSKILEVASTMLKTGLDAKIAKLDKKLKMAELQLKKEKLDKQTNSDDEVINSEEFVVTDRNSLIQKLKGIDGDK